MVNDNKRHIGQEGEGVSYGHSDNDNSDDKHAYASQSNSCAHLRVLFGTCPHCDRGIPLHGFEATQILVLRLRYYDSAIRAAIL